MNDNSEGLMLKIIEKVQLELKEIEDLNSVHEIKDKINKLLQYIENETTGNKSALAEIIYCKIKETRGIYPQLNASLYLLYRNLNEGKITIQEAQKLFDMYIKECKRA